MLSSRRGTAVVVVTLAAGGWGGCGGAAKAPDATSSPSKTSSATTGTTGRGNGPIPESFPSRPQVNLLFSRGPSDELPGLSAPVGEGGVEDGSYRLKLLRDGKTLRAPARARVTPGDRDSIVIAQVPGASKLDARVGVFCRGSEDGRRGYELTVDRKGRVLLERVEDGARRVLADYEARVDAAIPPDDALPIFLFCTDGKDGKPLLGVFVGIEGIRFYNDPDPFDPGPRSGLVVNGEATASVDVAAFQLWIEK